MLCESHTWFFFYYVSISWCVCVTNITISIKVYAVFNFSLLLALCWQIFFDHPYSDYISFYIFSIDISNKARKILRRIVCFDTFNILPKHPFVILDRKFFPSQETFTFISSFRRNRCLGFNQVCIWIGKKSFLCILFQNRKNFIGRFLFFFFSPKMI